MVVKIMINNTYTSTASKIRTKTTSILTEKYPTNGVNQWSIPILNSQPTMGFSRGDELVKLIGDPPIYLDYSSVSGGTL